MQLISNFTVTNPSSAGRRYAALNRPASLFTRSAGVLLLAIASTLFLINWTSPLNMMHPRDPFFRPPLPRLVWIIGSVALAVALVCLFSEKPRISIFLVAWMAANALAGEIAIFCMGGQGLSGFLGDFSRAFGIPARTANILANVSIAYLLIGSGVAIWRFKPERDGSHHSSVVLKGGEAVKMSCPACGAHIEFARQSLNQKIPCPRCQKTVTLRPPENLKMTCFFCHEHIEFPAHAIGQQIECPHCNHKLLLKEP